MLPERLRRTPWVISWLATGAMLGVRRSEHRHYERPKQLVGLRRRPHDTVVHPPVQDEHEGNVLRMARGIKVSAASEDSEDAAGMNPP